MLLWRAVIREEKKKKKKKNLPFPPKTIRVFLTRRLSCAAAWSRCRLLAFGVLGKSSAQKTELRRTTQLPSIVRDVHSHPFPKKQTGVF